MRSAPVCPLLSCHARHPDKHCIPYAPLAVASNPQSHGFLPHRKVHIRIQRTKHCFVVRRGVGSLINRIQAVLYSTMSCITVQRRKGANCLLDYVLEGCLLLLPVQRGLIFQQCVSQVHKCLSNSSRCPGFRFAHLVICHLRVGEIGHNTFMKVINNIDLCKLHAGSGRNRVRMSWDTCQTRGEGR